MTTNYNECKCIHSHFVERQLRAAYLWMHKSHENKQTQFQQESTLSMHYNKKQNWDKSKFIECTPFTTQTNPVSSTSSFNGQTTAGAKSYKIKITCDHFFFFSAMQNMFIGGRRSSPLENFLNTHIRFSRALALHIFFCIQKFWFTH